MSRQWTRRRQTPLNGEALDPEAFAQAYPLFRADPVTPGAANKEALGLVLGFTCLALPFHLAMKWLTAFSLPLAAGIGGAVAVGLLAVAVARRLGLDDLLRKLPVVLIVVLVAYGLYLLSTARREQTLWGGVEWVGLFLLITTVASVAASFYQPAAAAYRTVTQGTPVPTLVTASAVTALSVGVAVLGQTTPLFVQQAVGCVVVFAYAGLVLFEYAAWVKADPASDLSTHLAQVAAAETDSERDALTLPPRRGWRFFWEAIEVGVMAAVLLVMGVSCLLPNSELPRLLAALDPAAADQLPEFFLCGSFVAGLLLLLCLFTASGALDAAKLTQGVFSVFLAWKPLVVFLTYPDTRHPLAHRLRFHWLRPKAVRLGLTATVLLLIPSANNSPSATPTTSVTSPPAPSAVTPLPIERPHPMDADLARILGGSPDEWARAEQPPVRALTPTPPASTAADAGPSGFIPPPFLVILFFAVIGPPAVVYLAVAILGVLILPAYHAIAKEAQTPTA